MNNFELQIKKQIDAKIESCKKRGTVSDIEAIVRKSQQSNEKGNVLDMHISDDSITNLEFKEMLFDGCVFENVNFQMIELKDTQMVNCVFVNCNFERCCGLVSFAQSLFSSVKLFGCEFVGANFVKSTFWKFTLSNSNVKNANFSLSNYNEIKIENSEYQNTMLELKNKDKDKVREINSNAKYHILAAASSLLKLGTDLDKDNALQKEFVKIDDYVNKLKESIEVNEYIQISQEQLDEILEEHDRKVEQPVKKDGNIYLDLRGYDFSGKNLQEHNLTGIDFSNSNFQNAILAGCTCYDCDFTNCNLNNSILYDIRLMRNDFSGAVLDNVVIDKKNRKILIDAGILNQNKVKHDVPNFKEDAYINMEDDRDFDEDDNHHRSGVWLG